jgi:hypothetical protein
VTLAFWKKRFGVRLFVLCAAFLLSSCVGPKAPLVSTSRPNIIFDTDMGSDCDDAGALAILNKLADNGEINLLGVIFSSGKNRFGIGVCDAINTFYGRGDLPLGQYQHDDVGDPLNTYSQQIAAGTNTYGHDVIDSADDLAATYKTLLREQPDNSVIIVMVGHPNGLVHLMRDAQGMDLIRKKVRFCVAMTYTGERPVADWNFGRNGAAVYTREFLQNWPHPIFFSGAGKDILTGNKKLSATPLDNPVREAYRLFQNSLVKGRPSWDPIAALFAARPKYFEVDAHGSLEQNRDLQTFWNTNAINPRHYRVKPRLGNSEMEQIIEDLISAPPANRRSRIRKKAVAEFLKSIAP